MSDDKSQTSLQIPPKRSAILGSRWVQRFAARIGILLGLVLAIPTLGLSLILVLWASRKLDESSVHRGRIKGKASAKDSH